MEGDMTTPVSPGISENGYHPDGGESAPARQQWRDGFQERDFNQAGSGTQWEDWSQVMRAALDPPLGCLEEVLRRTPIDDPLDQAEASGLYRLTVEQITAPCSQYNLELRSLQMETQAIRAVLEAGGSFGEDEPLNPDPAEYQEFRSFITMVPVTKRECHARLAMIQERSRVLHSLITEARNDGVYYDVCELLDWFATPPEFRTTTSPSHVLPFFGQVLFGALGLSGQNTSWAHLEAVVSRQVAPRFGGSYDENEKTRQRQPNVLRNGAGDQGQGG